MPLKNNIVLIGMSGAGKSTLGAALAQKLQMVYLDTDALIVASEGRSLKDILQKDGAERLKEIETEVILKLSGECTVIATGGSVVYSNVSMAHLKTLGTIIYLSACYEVIEERVSSIDERGIVSKPGQTLKDVYLERLPLYESYADLSISTEKRTIENCIEKIEMTMKIDHRT
jgi:shikimate kinase